MKDNLYENQPDKERGARHAEAMKDLGLIIITANEHGSIVGNKATVSFRELEARHALSHGRVLALSKDHPDYLRVENVSGGDGYANVAIVRERDPEFYPDDFHD